MLSRDHPAILLLEEKGIAPEAGEALLVRRNLKSDGGSRAFVGGSSVPAGLLRDVEERSAQTFQTVPITDSGADLGAVGLKRPTATWTYLVQDNPFGTDIDRALRSVGRLLRGPRQ